ncbi:GNAT family N-acetyltransferase [Bacillus sp. KH172YL63]|uniref:GNAT family N-acetyltransferase n=1 Tax=Bacillus sp. KH172YL63 TaxID=2709784 RepID=UPI0013E453DC|nr:GNAT family N-acetyltransferase [Bacillus sp. KH172YL63]BCB03663.1 acetyltransferase [Bacillus sp. KH172YL63]
MEETKTFHIREVKREDAQAILHIHREVLSENNYFISVLEEFGRTDEEQIDWVQGILANERETLLVAEMNNRIVGWLVFKSQERRRLMHTGSFGVMIQRDFRGRGIGRELIMELLDWAEKNPLLEKISLGVFSTNERAISLYKQLGFQEEGRKVKEFKFGENEYVDDILMYKLV